MAIGWLTVLKMVPWTDVISNAPVVADGAKKLWNTVAKKSSTPAPSGTISPALSPGSNAVAVLQAQLVGVELTVAELQQQMLASSGLIQALADQNTQLIQRVEVNRIRLWWLSAATAVLGIVAVVIVANPVLPLVGQ